MACRRLPSITSLSKVLLLIPCIDAYSNNNHPIILSRSPGNCGFSPSCSSVQYRTQQLERKQGHHHLPPSLSSSLLLSANKKNEEWTSDFEDFADFEDSSSSLSFSSDDLEEEDNLKIAELLQEKISSGVRDLSGCQTRQFSLGEDLVLDSFLGNMGFEEVTDWEYYYQDEDDPEERNVVQPNPFDESKPKRTRSKSGSVVRLFRGEFVGMIGGMISSQGFDRRVLVKEYSGDLALELAQGELSSLGMLQSDLLLSAKEISNKEVEGGEWIKTASARSVMGRQDNANLISLLKLLGTGPYMGILGEVNLAELEGNMDPNEFYRAMGVTPPKPGAVWIVYEYAGLATLGPYSQPALVRRASIPPQKGLFGSIIPPPRLPKWKDRANYVVNGIMKSSLEAMSTLHDSGIAHRSIGRNSIILSSKTMDKRETSSPYATLVSQLVVKLSDFGFSTPLKDSTLDEDFCTRAKSFGLFFRKGEQASIAATNFAIAEDMHALGFVFMGLLLSSLAEPETENDPVPATDEDTLQRLLSDIFDKDISQFREYVEAEDVWSNLVELLDENDGVGWKVLETLFMARERAAKFKDSEVMLTAGGLVSSDFFK